MKLREGFWQNESKWLINETIVKFDIDRELPSWQNTCKICLQIIDFKSVIGFLKRMIYVNIAYMVSQNSYASLIKINKFKFHDYLLKEI